LLRGFERVYNRVDLMQRFLRCGLNRFRNGSVSAFGWNSKFAPVSSVMRKFCSGTQTEISETGTFAANKKEKIQKRKEMLQSGIGPDGRKLRFWERWLMRIFLDTESVDGKQNPLLKMVGYYSQESRCIEAARAVYEGAIIVSEDDKFLDRIGIRSEQRDVFGVRFEMLSVHIWMAYVRLRQTGDYGNIVMQAVSDRMFADLQNRMILEEGVGAFASYKLIKECEHKFFALCMSLDADVYLGNHGVDFLSAKNAGRLKEDLKKYIECLEGDDAKAASLLAYMQRALLTLEGADLQTMYDGRFWDPSLIAEGLPPIES